MLCGVMSGSGKTTVTCGLLQALVNRGLRDAAGEVGIALSLSLIHI